MSSHQRSVLTSSGDPKKDWALATVPQEVSTWHCCPDTDTLWDPRDEPQSLLASLPD